MAHSLLCRRRRKTVEICSRNSSAAREWQSVALYYRLGTLNSSSLPNHRFRSIDVASAHTTVVEHGVCDGFGTGLGGGRWWHLGVRAIDVAVVGFRRNTSAERVCPIRPPDRLLQSLVRSHTIGAVLADRVAALEAARLARWSRSIRRL